MSMKWSLLPIIFLTICGCATAPTGGSKSQHQETGQASFYADKFQNRKTANGERYDHNQKTAAHKSLSFGTMVKVTNRQNGESVVVRINDRGPFAKGRIIDLSKSAFTHIAHTESGLIDVSIEAEK